MGNKRYSSVGWTIAEYLALFLIVTLHEFGHAMACRQVGGTANQIVLWPLGGTAYVDPPPRPGATLWSIAAGPLVNVALLPLLYGALLGPIGRLAFGRARFVPTRAVGSVSRCRPAGVQHAAHLPVGRRADSPVTSLVCHRARQEFARRYQSWLSWSRWFHRLGGLASFALVRCARFFHADELLERIAARACAAATREVATP